MKKLLLLASIVLLPASAAPGEPLVALTGANQLIRFNSPTPGTITSTVTISGLTAGDVLAGIDVRPSNNTLYAFATDAGLGMSAVGMGRVYSINLATGLATLSATLAPMSTTRRRRLPLWPSRAAFSASISTPSLIGCA